MLRTDNGMNRTNGSCSGIGDCKSEKNCYFRDFQTFTIQIRHFNVKPYFSYLFILSFLYVVENELFLGHIFRIEILVHLHIYVNSTESKNYIFTGWSVCVCVSVST